MWKINALFFLSCCIYCFKILSRDGPRILFDLFNHFTEYSHQKPHQNQVPPLYLHHMFYLFLQYRPILKQLIENFHLLSLLILTHAINFQVVLSGISRVNLRSFTRVKEKKIKKYSLYFIHRALRFEAFLWFTFARESPFLAGFNAYLSLSNPKQSFPFLTSYETMRSTASATFFPPMTAASHFGWVFSDKAQSACHTLRMNKASRNCIFTFIFANQV